MDPTLPDAALETARRELRGHIARLAVWSGVCLVLALGLLGAGGEVVRGATGQAFLTWNAGWCFFNLVICLASWRGKPPDDVRKLREFLMLNEGLNVAYIGVGLTLALASPLPGVQGAGWAVALQGLALLLLDTILLTRLPRGA